MPTQNGAYFNPGSFDFGNDYAGLTDLVWDQLTSETHVDVDVDVGIGENGVITNLFGYRYLRDTVGQDSSASTSRRSSRSGPALYDRLVPFFELAQRFLFVASHMPVATIRGLPPFARTASRK